MNKGDAWLREKMDEVQNNCSLCKQQKQEHYYFISFLPKDGTMEKPEESLWQNLCETCLNGLFNSMLKLICNDKARRAKLLKGIKKLNKPMW